MRLKSGVMLQNERQLPRHDHTHTRGESPPPWSCRLMAGRTIAEPCPLLYLRVQLGNKRCWALLDSGAADNFIAATTVKAANLSIQPLGMPWAVSLGNGDIVYTNHYTLTNLQVGDYAALTCFKVLATDLAMVLGYPFLLKHRPQVDWKLRTVRFMRRGKEYVVKGYAGNCISKDELNRVETLTGDLILDEWVKEDAVRFGRLTARKRGAVHSPHPEANEPLDTTSDPENGLQSDPESILTKNVANTEDEDTHYIGEVVGGELPLEDNHPLVTVDETPISELSDTLDVPSDWASTTEAEAITSELTGSDLAEVADERPYTIKEPLGKAPRLKHKRKRESFRKTIKVDLTQIDHTICGPPCKTVLIHPDILALNKEFADIFPDVLPAGLPPERGTEHHIPIKEGSTPPSRRTYRMSPKEEKILLETLKDLLQKGFIERAKSPYGAGVLFVPKPNGKWRMCVDYRPLNAISIVDDYPLPRIGEMIDQAGRAKYFSKLDLHSGFHQIQVAPEDIPKTAFKTKFGSFQFKVMPFGLMNAPATFQRTMDLLIEDMREFAGMYIDDLLVFSNTMEEHIQHLRKVYERLRRQ